MSTANVNARTYSSKTNFNSNVIPSLQVQQVKALIPNVIQFFNTTDNTNVAEQFPKALWGTSKFPSGLEDPFKGVDNETKNILYLLIKNQAEKSKKSPSRLFQKPTKKPNVEQDKIVQALRSLSKLTDETLAKIIKELPSPSSPLFNNIEINTLPSRSIDSNNKVNQLLVSTEVSHSGTAIPIEHKELTSDDIVGILKDSKLEFAGCGKSLTNEEVKFINDFIREYEAMDEYNPTLLKAKMQPYLEQLYAFYWSQKQDFINECASSGKDILCTHLVGPNANFDKSKLYEQLKRDELNKEHFKTNADDLISLHGLIGYMQFNNQIQYVYINPIVYLLLLIKYTDLEEADQIRLAGEYVDRFSEFSKKKID